MRSRGLIAALAAAAVVLGAAGGASAYVPPIKMTVFQLPDGHPSGPMVAGLDGNMWLQEGDGVFEYPPPRVAVMNPHGDIVKELPAGGAGALGPDGNFWFEYGPKIGRMTPAGDVTYFRMLSTAEPAGITTGPDGNLWFFDQSGNLYRITTAGAITKVFHFANDIGGIAAGADGNLWVTEFFHTAIVARVTPAGAVTEFPFPRADGEPRGIAAGPDGNLWVAERHRNVIARVTTDGVITEFRLARAGAGPSGIVAGVDGNLWFTEEPACCPMQPMTGRIAPDGTVTEFQLPAAASFQGGVFAGGDGNVWYALGGSYNGATGAVGRMSVAQRPGVRYVLSRDAGLAPGKASAALGNTVQWEFYGPSVHEVADTSGFGLFDSGPRSIVSSFRKQFMTAGVYTYGDPLDLAHTGKVTVAPQVGGSTDSSPSGPITGIDASWSIGPVTGSRVFDVQVRRPGETSYSDWKMGTTDDASGFPVSGPGTYSVRARMRDTATGAKTGYASRSLTVK